MSQFSDRLRWWIATCLGLGLSPVFPGSCAALLGVVYYVAVALYAPAAAQTWLLLAGLLASCWVTIALAPWAEGYFRAKDSKHFTTDEIAGFLVTVVLFRTSNVLATALWAYFVTRVIDIAKVPPARRLEKLPAGWGVLADDVLGSIYAAGLLHALRYWMPTWFT